MSIPSVLLTTHGESLRFEDPQQQNKFELGVASAVFLWDDLATAVANGWGGPESEAKREWLAGSVIELFDADEVATEDVEYRLLAAMEDEFDVTIETGTAMNVARQIIQIWQDCASHNYASAQEMFDKFQTQQPAAAQVTVQDEEDDSSDGDNDADEKPAEEEPMLMEVEETQATGPVVDEDGFTLVQKKGRR